MIVALLTFSTSEKYCILTYMYISNVSHIMQAWSLYKLHSIKIQQILIEQSHSNSRRASRGEYSKPRVALWENNWQRKLEIKPSLARHQLDRKLILLKLLDLQNQMLNTKLNWRILYLYLLQTIRYVFVSVVNDVALARTIASPLLLKVAKISLDKTS